MLKVVRRGPVLVENEKIKNLFAGGQLGDKKWTSEWPLLMKIWELDIS